MERPEEKTTKDPGVEVPSSIPRLSPLWNRLGAFVSRHGEHFYNLKGLRRYKEKFKPEWEPKYLAATGGLALSHILTNVASLILGNIKGVILNLLARDMALRTACH